MLGARHHPFFSNSEGYFCSPPVVCAHNKGRKSKLGSKLFLEQLLSQDLLRFQKSHISHIRPMCHLEFMLVCPSRRYDCNLFNNNTRFCFIPMLLRKIISLSYRGIQNLWSCSSIKPFEKTFRSAHEKSLFVNVG